jgi:Fe-S cluster biosynthesis and repair protein YggX
MAETVTCVRCGATNPRISSFIGFYGELKQRLQDNVCEPCWQEWLRYQLMAINEYRLNLGTEAHRQILEKLVTEFTKLDGEAPSEDGTPRIDDIDRARTPEKE